MEDRTPLEQVLGKAPEPEQVKEADPTGAEVKAEKVETPPEPDKPETTEKADSSPESEPSMIPVSALHGERDRRQALDKQVKELQQELERIKTAKPQERPSVFEDEEGAFKAYQETITSEFTSQFLSAGAQEAITQHGQDAVDAAVEWAQQTAPESPSLDAKIRNTPPILLHRKIVEMHKQELARQELADPDKLREKIRQEEREKLLKAQKEQLEAEKAKRNSIPKSLVGEDSKGGLKGTDSSGPTPLDAA